MLKSELFRRYINICYLFYTLKIRWNSPIKQSVNFGYDRHKFDIKFRDQKGVVIPDVEFSLDDEILLREIKVTVSPTSHPEESYASAYSLLRWRTEYSHAIRNSRIPFRYW